MTHYVPNYTTLTSNRNISETLIEDDAITAMLLQECLVNFLMKPRLIGFTLVVLELLILNFHQNFLIPIIEVFKFSRTENIKQNQKANKVHSKHLNIVRHLRF